MLHVNTPGKILGSPALISTELGCLMPAKSLRGSQFFHLDGAAEEQNTNLSVLGV